jgi:hypothetical protein
MPSGSDCAVPGKLKPSRFACVVVCDRHLLSFAPSPDNDHHSLLGSRPAQPRLWVYCQCCEHTIPCLLFCMVGVRMCLSVHQNPLPPPQPPPPAHTHTPDTPPSPDNDNHPLLSFSQHSPVCGSTASAVMDASATDMGSAAVVASKHPCELALCTVGVSASVLVPHTSPLPSPPPNTPHLTMTTTPSSVPAQHSPDCGSTASAGTNIPFRACCSAWWA